MDDIYDRVNKLYTDGTFATKYGGDILISRAIIIIMLVVLCQYMIVNYSRPIIADWENRRCDPAIIPFAGIINAPKGTSVFEFTGKNFEACVQESLKGPAKLVLPTLSNRMKDVSNLYKPLADNVKWAREDIARLRGNAAISFKNLYDSTLNLTIPLAHFIDKAKSILNKSNATLLNGIYTIRGGIITSESIFLYVYEQILKVLWVMHAFIISCFTIGWMFPPTLAAGMSAASFLSLLLIPLVSFISIMEALGPGFLKARLTPPPTVPTQRMCFAGDTMIATKYDRNVMIKDLVLGQELQDGSIVTALMKSTSKGSSLYRLGDVIVTGTHKIYDSNMGWIDVSQYSNKIPIENFNEPYVYCIGTDSKVIRIGENVFSDWDEVDDKMISKLCGETISRLDIHKHFDVGLHPDTNIQLQCGKIIKIKDVNVNDILICGAVVETLVKVKTDDIKEFCDINYNGKFIVSATKNTEFIVEAERKVEFISVTPPDVCYHIVTNSGGFKTAGIFISDYNRGIDKFFA